MKTTQNKTKRIEIRLTEQDYRLFKASARFIGTDASKLLRMFVDTTVNGIKIKIKQGEIKIEDIETILND